MSIEMIEPEVGMKHDSGKLDYTLVPWDGLEDVIRVLEFGANKYSRDNWRKVENAEARYPQNPKTPLSQSHPWLL